MLKICPRYAREICKKKLGQNVLGQNVHYFYAKCPWGILSWGILSFGAKCLGAKCLLASFHNICISPKLLPDQMQSHNGHSYREVGFSTQASQSRNTRAKFLISGQNSNAILNCACRFAKSMTIFLCITVSRNIVTLCMQTTEMTHCSVHCKVQCM